MPTTPRYKKLRNLLHDKIVSGRYAVGDRFLSQNDLIKKYNLSFSTVSRALEELVREGFLTRETGKGTFIKSIDPGIGMTGLNGCLNIYVFVPIDRLNSGSIDPTKLFQYIEANRPDNYSIRMIPHSTGPDDLDFFLFTRDPVHVAIFIDPLDSQHHFREILSQTCPILVVGVSGCAGGISSLVIDYAGATGDAVAYLIAMGHQQVAIVVGRKDNIACMYCLDAYRSAYSAASRAVESSMVLYTDSASIEHDLTRLFQDTDHNPSAMLVMDPFVVPEALSAIRLAGLTIPEDVSLACLDSTDFTAKMSPPLSSIFISPEGIALKILEIIPRLAYGEIVDDVFKCRFLSRESNRTHPAGLARVK